MLPAPVRLVLAAVLALAATACSAGEPSADPGSGPPSVPAPADSAASPATGRIAVLMPGTPRRDRGFERAAFTRSVAALCPDCEIDYFNARRDPAAQATQLADAVEAGARVLVLNAVEPFAVAGLVRTAQESGAEVVGYDTLLDDLDHYVGLDREQVGRAQARTLLRAGGRSGSLVLLHGSPADPDAMEVKAAAHEIIDRSGATVVGELDALPDRPGATVRWLRTILDFYPPETIAGVYAADDTLAHLAVDALLAAGADPAALPPVTGAGATRAAVQRIVAGQQLMTVYRPVEPAAATTARVAVGVLTGSDPGDPSAVVDGLPTYLLDPTAVLAEDVGDTVVADGYWTAEQICTRPYRAACTRAGIR